MAPHSRGRVRVVRPTRLPVALYVRNPDSVHRDSRLVKLVAVCSPLDFDDPSPAITLTMPDEG